MHSSEKKLFLTLFVRNCASLLFAGVVLGCPQQPPWEHPRSPRRRTWSTATLHRWKKNTLVSIFLKYFLRFEEKHRLNEKFHSLYESHPFEVVLRGRRHLTKCFVLAISRRGWLTLQEIWDLWYLSDNCDSTILVYRINRKCNPMSPQNSFDICWDKLGVLLLYKISRISWL